MLSRRVFLVPLLLAAVLRFADLRSRPMHADESIHADKFATLLEGRGYAYDPAEYHGPTLYYLTLVPAWLRGERRYVEIDELTLRSVPAMFGLALVAAHLLARGSLGALGAVAAAFFTALSPAMVFYSRYFIHETLLVFWSFGALLAASRCLRAPAPLPAIAWGACAGLMLATKETAPLALFSMLLAFALTRLEGGGDGERRGWLRRVLPGRLTAMALVTALLVATSIFSSFLARPTGAWDAARAYGFYLDRAQAASSHFHTWSYYLGLLIHFPSEGTPFWTEGLILVLAIVGAASGWIAKEEAGADARFLRFLTSYTLFLLVLYSAIPYKTPWCLLGFLHGMILLAGAGTAFLLRSLRGKALGTVVVALVAATAHLGWQAYASSFRFAADPRNPYVYAHTGTDVFAIVDRVTDVARDSTDGSPLKVQVMSGANLWPLPFYLRGRPEIEWWNGVPEKGENAPVVLVTPDMEEALLRKLYDRPPPGERELYVSLFDRAVFLRPGVEVRGYATSRLWEDYRRREAEKATSAPDLTK